MTVTLAPATQSSIGTLGVKKSRKKDPAIRIKVVTANLDRQLEDLRLNFRKMKSDKGGVMCAHDQDEMYKLCKHYTNLWEAVRTKKALKAELEALLKAGREQGREEIIKEISNKIIKK